MIEEPKNRRTKQACDRFLVLGFFGILIFPYGVQVRTSRGTGLGGVMPLARMTFSTAAIISGSGRKLPGRCPWAIISGVQPHLFLLFHTLMSAPRSSKS